MIVEIQDDLTRRKTHPRLVSTVVFCYLQSSFVIMSDEDPKPGTSKDSTSFMDFDDVEEDDDEHQSNVRIEAP